MTGERVLTVRAHGYFTDDTHSALVPMAGQRLSAVPVLIVYGLTESEKDSLPNLLEKSREVCEWYQYESVDCKTVNASHAHPLDLRTVLFDAPTFCPSCGRKVKLCV